jgi:hypothetical protein
MNRANVVLLMLALTAASGTSAIASGTPMDNSPTSAQSVQSGETMQNQAGSMAMDIPMLVYVDARGQVRDIQHSQRLPSKVNDLLWQSVKSWTKTSAVINGRHEGAQLFMNVVLHAEPQSGGTTNVYFTLASEGPVLRGYWIMHDNYMYGHCSPTGIMSGGYGGKEHGCFAQTHPVPASSAPEPASK